MTELLRKNLSALASVDAKLCERFCWPVSDAHVQRINDRDHYRLSREWVPLSLSEEDIRQALQGVDATQNLFLFGVGTGELLAALAQEFPGCEIVAWEADPWLWRLCLSRYDLAAPIRSRRLKPALGIDLAVLTPRMTGRTVVLHPLLASVYDEERILLAQGLRQKHALVSRGGLFVKDIGASLRALGYSVMPLDLTLLSLEEMSFTVERFQPQFLVVVNYLNGLPEAARQWDLPTLCWEIDPSTDRIAPVPDGAKETRIFTYREKHVSAFQAAGFSAAEYLPLATNPERHHPLTLSTEERKRYAADVSFVGMSLRDHLPAYKDMVVKALTRFSGKADTAWAETTLAAILRDQATSWNVYRIPELLEQYAPGFALANPVVDQGHDPVKLVAEMAGAEKRTAYLRALGTFGICVWGDDGFRDITDGGGRYCGPAGHYAEITKIYNASSINVDINRLYQSDMITMRIFDILSCGGFVLAEACDALEELFVDRQDLVLYRDLEDLQRLIAHYLAHPDEARAIAEQGMAKVREKHTIASRLRHMLSRLDLPQTDG